MSDAETFAKLDAPPTVRAWAAEAVTVFANGFVSGLGTGIGVGGVAAAGTETLDVQVISLHAAGGVAAVAVLNGLKRVVIWHDSHPIPNPFA